MSNTNKQDSNNDAVPFFARYLEGQFCEELSEEEMAAVRGGQGMAVTLAYPSDPPENSGVDITSRTLDCDFKPHHPFPDMPIQPKFP